jgi:mono/diheme cytochrome c family protein
MLMAAVGLAVLAWAVGASANQPVVINATAVPPLPALDPERVTEGAALYAQQCARCHGNALEGTANWKQRLEDSSFPPPPHDNSGHTWHHSDAVLLEIITNGGDPAYNSRMPAFKDQLSEAQVVAILEFFKSRWGQEEREFQWWMTVTGSDSPK